MRKHRLYVTRRRGRQYRRPGLHFHRDTVTGEYSVCLSGFGRMRMFCMEKPIPELNSIVRDLELS